MTTVDAEVVNEAPQLPAVNGTPRGYLIAAAAEAKKIEAIFTVAQARPRDMIQVDRAVKEICTDPDFAEIALYDYSRGGQQVLGASIRLVEEIGHAYGRLYPCWEIIEQDENRAYVRAFCLDYETLNSPERKFFVELGFWKKHPDKKMAAKGEKVYVRVTDERDIRERIANIAQRQMRVCMEHCIGKRVMMRAVKQVQETLENPISLEIRQKKAADMIKAFAGKGVTEEMLCRYCKVPSLERLTAKKFSDMVVVWNTIKDGEAQLSDYFDMTGGAPPVVPPEAKPADKPVEKPVENKEAQNPAGKRQSTKPASGKSATAKPPAKEPEKTASASTAEDASTSAEQIQADATTTEAPDAVAPDGIDWNAQFGG